MHDNPDRIRDKRWLALLAAYCITHVFAWVLVPLFCDSRPSGDNLEQLRWAEHLAWGYDKHPPLPTLVLWLFEQIFPASVALTYALGGLQVAIMLGVAWWVARQLLDESRAIAAVLIISCITYYTNRLNYYNHNSVLLTAYALSVAATLKAAQSERPIWYAILGVTWGLGMLTKYQMAIAIACNAMFLCWLLRDNLPQLLARLAIACGVCALVLVPHVLWLIEHHFPSFDYAAKFVAAKLPWSQRPADIVGFLLDQLMRVAGIGAWLMILIRLPAVRASAQATNATLTNGFSWSPVFLAIHAWGPLVLMCSMSLVAGTDLQMHWGTAFLWTVPIWLLATRFARALALPLKTLFVAIAILQLIMLLSYFLWLAYD